MDLYTQKKRTKIVLFIAASFIIGASIFYTNTLVNRFAQEELKNVKLWAEAVHRKARLVNVTELLFQQLQDQERQRVELLATVYNYLLSDNDLSNPNYSSDLTFYLDIIQNNNTIPVIQTDENGLILNAKNLDSGIDTATYLRGKLLEDFSVYDPIEVPYADDRKNLLYYQDSRFFRELKKVLNDYVTSFMSEVALNSSSVPVIITDSSKTQVLQFGNLNDIRMTDPNYVKQKLEEMEDENDPISITFSDLGQTYIFYKDSDLLTTMQLYPLAQILIISIFAAIAYFLFSYARKSEQNRVWAGMAKETAHQIGTPLSSIMAWLELLKLGEGNAEKAATEIEKDIIRLEVISERFSKIGSVPKLEQNNLIQIIDESITYLKPRTPKKVRFQINIDTDQELFIPVNGPLFSWVIENLCKNAIDAMEGKGVVSLDLKEEAKQVILDISDTGKGISITEQKTIFNPGYTSKKRGWGLGLSLARRIVRDYHKGKIFVKSSTVGKGSVFRIILRK